LGELAARNNLLDALAHTRGTEAVVLTPSGAEVMRSRHATGVLESWFAPNDRGAHGLPRVWLERVEHLVNQRGPEMLDQDSWEHHQPDRSLRVTLVPLPEEDGRRLWGLVLKEVPHVKLVPESWKALLTPREVEVVEGVLQGWDNQTVAEHLGCSVDTVKTHMKRIFLKLRVPSRTKLIAAAQELV
jgi:ATP/maltotriose-dependent transcriptional regulator MalT